MRGLRHTKDVILILSFLGIPNLYVIYGSSLHSPPRPIGLPHGLTGSALDHRSLPTEFESRLAYKLAKDYKIIDIASSFQV